MRNIFFIRNACSSKLSCSVTFTKSQFQAGAALGLASLFENKDIFSSSSSSKDIPSSSSFSPRTLWLLSLAPASVLYTTFLYAIVLLFLAITYMAQLQAGSRQIFCEIAFTFSSFYFRGAPRYMSKIFARWEREKK